MKLINSVGILLWLAAISFALEVNAQNQHKLDSLYKLLNDTKQDTIQMKVNRKIARMYMDNNQTKALVYFEKAKNIAQKINRTLELADNYYSMGYCYLGKGDLDKSLENYLQSVKYYEQIAYDPSLADAYLSIISVYSELKNFTKAKDYIHKAEIALVNSRDSFQLCSLYSQSGNVYLKEGKNDSAFYFMKKGLSIAKAIHDKGSEIVCLSNIGLAYKKSNQNEEALLYCDSALQLIKNREDNLFDLAVVYNNIGAIQSQTGNYNLAEINFMKSIQYAKEAGILNVEMENYNNLSEMYEKKGDYKLYAFYLKKYTQLKDSMFTDESKNKIAQLETDYIVGKKDVELLKKDASIQKQTNLRNIFILVAFAMVVLLLLAVYFNRFIQQKRKEAEAQNKLIHHQKDELHNLNQVKDRLFSVISHDLRNPLNTLQSYLMLSDNESIAADKRLLFKNQSIQAVAQTGNLLDNLLTWANMQIRDTTPKIVPLNIQSIVQDVTDLLQPQAQQKGIQMNVNVEDIKLISDAAILSIALRNIMTNAVKFSYENGYVFIEGKKIETSYILSIKDTGIGMSVQQIQQIQEYKNTSSASGTKGEEGSGLGLFLVKQLLGKINVPLQIESEEGKGSTFILTFEMY